MKFLKLADEVLFNTELTSNEKIVYSVLLRLYNVEKECSYPSMEYISKSTGISLSTVKRSIKRLVSLGYCEINKKQSVNANFNAYSNLKYFIKNKEENKVLEETSINPKEIIEDPKEEVQVKLQKETEEVPEVSEFTREHKQKLGLILKKVPIKTRNQELIASDFDIETLKEALTDYEKSNGRNFTFLLMKYMDIAARKNQELSTNIKRYSRYAEFSREEIETRQALLELEQYGVPVY